MLGERFRVPRALLLALACACRTRAPGADVDGGSARAPADGEVEARETGAHADDDALIVPAGLSVVALEGGNGVLDVTALTLRAGPNGTEAYAALRNTGEVPACSAALAIELFDTAEQSVAAGIGGLLTQHFYRLTDGSGAVAACVGPGEVTMAALTDLPGDIAIDDVGTVVYRCPYFALDVEPIAGLAIGALNSAQRGAEVVYTGTLLNGLDVAVREPSVAVFPINRVGRPLGVATGSGAIELPPGGRWRFETDAVSALGVDQVAFPAGALAR